MNIHIHTPICKDIWLKREMEEKGRDGRGDRERVSTHSLKHGENMQENTICAHSLLSPPYFLPKAPTYQTQQTL